VNAPIAPGSPDWLRAMAACEFRCIYYDDAIELEAAADRIEQLERENAALRDTVEDLRRENVGLLADKGRLDWMNSYESNGKELKWITDFRAAIDAARAKEGGAT
jgi:hypothetical protein